MSKYLSLFAFVATLGLSLVASGCASKKDKDRDGGHGARAASYEHAGHGWHGGWGGCGSPCGYTGCDTGCGLGPYTANWGCDSPCDRNPCDCSTPCNKPCPAPCGHGHGYGWGSHCGHGGYAPHWGQSSYAAPMYGVGQWSGYSAPCPGCTPPVYSGR